MTELEIILLCILTAVSTASAVVIVKQHLEYKSFREEVSNTLEQLINQLRYQEMLIQDYQSMDEDGWETLH